MGNSWHSCAKVHEPIELLFGLMSVVGSGTGVLDGSTCPKGKGGFGAVLMSAC